MPAGRARVGGRYGGGGDPGHGPARPGAAGRFPNLRLIFVAIAGVDSVLRMPDRPAQVPVARTVDPGQRAARFGTSLGGGDRSGAAAAGSPAVGASEGVAHPACGGAARPRPDRAPAGGGAPAPAGGRSAGQSRCLKGNEDGPLSHIKFGRIYLTITSNGAAFHTDAEPFLIQASKRENAPSRVRLISACAPAAIPGDPGWCSGSPACPSPCARCGSPPGYPGCRRVLLPGVPRRDRAARRHVLRP